MVEKDDVIPNSYDDGSKPPASENLLASEWNRQIDRYIALGFHRELGQTEEAYRAGFPPVPSQPPEYEGRFDHMVLVDPRVPFMRQLEAVGVTQWPPVLDRAGDRDGHEWWLAKSILPERREIASKEKGTGVGGYNLYSDTEPYAIWVRTLRNTVAPPGGALEGVAAGTLGELFAFAVTSPEVARQVLPRAAYGSFPIPEHMKERSMFSRTFPVVVRVGGDNPTLSVMSKENLPLSFARGKK